MDATVLTYREYELVRNDFYAETLDEIISLALDEDQNMEVTIQDSEETINRMINVLGRSAFCLLGKLLQVLILVPLLVNRMTYLYNSFPLKFFGANACVSS
ncbi:hypothetical protein E3U55_09105 [Filobacillus milosensis]|uniref:Uncharacterized protein n=1 Tax=Filobacillus milosensis TaxID=94137 RepID=A0A4Y8IML3_9BACI|nr:hypothetical protein [Filobacillus milosensis]TFB21458.1 hypothetical protein E3U55_09105 [Filobacillus milosensis]